MSRRGRARDRHDENFPVGSRLIARRYRDPMHRFYTFARNADDIADSPDLSAAGQARPPRCHGRRPARAPARRVHPARWHCAPAWPRPGSPRRTRPTCWSHSARTRPNCAMRRSMNLYNYCNYSAVPVGRYVLDLHGESHDCYPPSDALCMSLQILNHMQDCGEGPRGAGSLLSAAGAARSFRRLGRRFAPAGRNAGPAPRVRHIAGPGRPDEPRGIGTARNRPQCSPAA